MRDVIVIFTDTRLCRVVDEKDDAMGKNTTNDDDSGLGTVLLCLIILSLAVVPYIFFPFNPFETGEEEHGVARARASTKSPRKGQPATRRDAAVPVVQKKTPNEASTATDPVTDVIRRIKDSNFQGLDSVMTGRYLKAYQKSHEPVLVETVDLDRVRLHSRGDDWIFLEAPYQPDSEWHADAIPWNDASAEGTARMRLVRRDGEWKLENVQIQPGL